MYVCVCAFNYGRRREDIAASVKIQVGHGRRTATNLRLYILLLEAPLEGAGRAHGRTCTPRWGYGRMAVRLYLGHWRAVLRSGSLWVRMWIRDADTVHVPVRFGVDGLLYSL